MKFLNNTYVFLKELDSYENNFLDSLNYCNFFFEKNFITKSKYIYKSKSGIIKNVKKSSVVRDKNVSFINQYIDLNQKKGKKFTFFKNFNKSMENIFYILNNYSEEFKVYENYSDFVFLFSNNYYSSNSNDFIFNSIKDLESIFEIKTIKNNKKLKLPNKYTHEIIYIPKKRRLKYILRALSIYKENFKNYNLWERLFWSLLLTVLNKKKSFLNRRRNFIYSKSIKFFKIKNK